jgi:serine/threonine-protein kinase SRPK3
VTIAGFLSLLPHLNRPSLARYRYTHLISSMPPKDEESPADYNYGGYLQVNVADTFKDGRYTIVRKLGSVSLLLRPRPASISFSWGHFSTVWLVKDSPYVVFTPPLYPCQISSTFRDRGKRHSALKIIKSAGRYSETARDEIRLLRQITNASPSHPGRAHIVSFLDSFTHTLSSTAHICIIFEPLGANLLSLVEKNRRKGVPPCVVKSITRQVLLGLQYLHDECDLVHTDIKPENISQSHVVIVHATTSLTICLVMCIPDIESQITAQLCTSPPPQTHKLPIPPNPRSRRVAALTSHALPVPSRSVHIVESQPLSTPPEHYRHYSRLESSGSLGASSYTDSLLRPASSLSSPATSLGSAMSKLKLTSPERPTGTPLKNAVLHMELDEDSSARVVPARPSLLTQTAPSHPRAPKPSRHNSFSSSSSSESPSSSDSSSSSSSDSSPSLPPPTFHPVLVKIADLGNATPSKRHFTEDIQTRQYRSPEAIIGRSDWNCKVDLWSVACVVRPCFEVHLLRADKGQLRCSSC